MNVRRRIERQWIEGIKSLRQINSKIVAAAERTLQKISNNDGSLVPVPVRAVVDRRRLDQSRPRD
jgi:hypothetical protein